MTECQVLPSCGTARGYWAGCRAPDCVEARRHDQRTRGRHPERPERYCGYLDVSDAIDELALLLGSR